MSLKHEPYSEQHVTAPVSGGVGLDVVVELCAGRRDT